MDTNNLLNIFLEYINTLCRHSTAYKVYKLDTNNLSPNYEKMRKKIIDEVRIVI